MRTSSTALCALILLMAGIALTTGGASAGAALPDLLRSASVESFLEYAASESPRLRASYENWMAAAAAVGQARGWPDPQLSYAHYLSEVETALGPQQHRIGLSQRIPWFGKLSSQGDAAERHALAAEQRFLMARLDLYTQVTAAYYEYAYLARALEVTGENLELVRYQEEVVRARYRLDAIPYGDVIKVQIELAVLEDRIQTLEDRRGAAAALLNASLGREATAELPWSVPLDPPPHDSHDEAQVLAAVERTSPELLALDHEIDAADRRLDAARKAGYPDFTLGVQTILTAESELTSFPDRGRNAWMASVAVNLPLGRGKYRAGVDAAQARRRGAEFTRQDRSLQLAAEARDTLFRMRDAQRRIQLYSESLLPKAEQALRATSTDFSTGRASFLDYMDAQRSLLRFELDLARARADFGRRVMEIARLVGAAPIEAPELAKGQP